MRSSHKEVERQLNADRDARALEAERQKQAIATALLFEIVNFYKYYFTHLRPLLDQVDVETCQPPSFSAPSTDFFSVYQGSANSLGTFDHMLVEKVVRSYGLMAWLFSSIREYTRSLDQELNRQHSVAPGSAPRKILTQIKSLMYESDAAAVGCMRDLCTVAGVQFDSLRFTS